MGGLSLMYIVSAEAVGARGFTSKLASSLMSGSWAEMADS